MAKQLLGRVAMDFKGEFNSSSTYEKLDVVVYRGCSYCALKETKRNLPTNEEFFTLLVRKPISGIDYFTEDEKEEFVSRITEDANSLFNQNAENKTKEFNTNHQDKVNDFNNNYDTKLSSFDSNYDSKVKSFNNNANNQTTTFNENVTEKQKEFDDNVTNQAETFNTNTTNKINEYDTNASNKLNDYNSNDTTKLKAYNDNASTKVEEYNTNANNKVEEFNTNAEEKTNEFNSTANAQKITNLSNEFYRVKDEILETGEASDTFIHLEDSSMSELQELEIEGVCQQKTTNGINLLPEVADKSARTSGGVTLTFSENNKMKLSGTTTDKSIYFDMKLKETISLTKDVYVHIRNNVGNGNVAIALLLDNSQKGWRSLSDINTISNFTDIKSDEFEVNTLRVFINPNQTVDVTLQPSLENTSNTTNYEPYTGGEGNASPNPEYPQEIKTITENFNLTSCNKNLFNKDDMSMYLQSLVPDNNGLIVSGSTNTSTSSNFIKSIILRCKPNTIYTISKLADKTFYIYDCEKYPDLGYQMRVVLNNQPNSSNYTFVTGSNAKYIVFKFFNTWANESYSYEDEVASVQVERKDIATSLEKYLQSRILISLPKGEFLGKLDDTYKDTLNIVYNEEEGQYHLMLRKAVSKFTIDENTNLIYGANDKYSNYIVQIELNNLSQNIENKVLSTSFTYTYNNWNNDLEGICVGGNNSDRIQIKIKSSRLESNTLAGFKKWLSKNPIEVYYPLAESYELDLGPVEMPLSYNEVTNIFTDSDLLPKINAKYYRNFKKTVQNLQVNNDTLKNELISIENRLTALENANTSTVDVDESEVTE